LGQYTPDGFHQWRIFEDGTVGRAAMLLKALLLGTCKKAGQFLLSGHGFRVRTAARRGQFHGFILGQTFRTSPLFSATYPF
jgi:hypothetical protein